MINETRQQPSNKKSIMKLFAEEDLCPLLTECFLGNRGAQRKIYQRYYSFAIGICIRYANNREECVKIMNEGFFKLFQKPDLCANNKTFHIKLQKIMIDSILKYYQQDIDIHFTMPGNKEMNIQLTADKKIHGHQLLNLLRQLPALQRIIFNLYVIDGYTHIEIEKMMRKAKGFSEKWLFIARNTLSRISG